MKYKKETYDKIKRMWDEIDKTIKSFETAYIIYSLPMIVDKYVRPNYDFYHVRRGNKYIIAVDDIDTAVTIKNKLLAVTHHPDFLLKQAKHYNLNIKTEYVYGDIYLAEICEMPETATGLTKEQIIDNAKASKEMFDLIPKINEKLEDNIMYNVTSYNYKHYRRLTYYDPTERKRKQSAIGDVFIAVVAHASEIKVIERTPQKTRVDKIKQNPNAIQIGNAYFMETK